MSAPVNPPELPKLESRALMLWRRNGVDLPVRTRAPAAAHEIPPVMKKSARAGVGLPVRATMPAEAPETLLAESIAPSLARQMPTTRTVASGKANVDETVLCVTTINRKTDTTHHREKSRLIVPATRTVVTSVDALFVQEAEVEEEIAATLILVNTSSTRSSSMLSYNSPRALDSPLDTN
jgi:hypothetical protein